MVAFLARVFRGLHAMIGITAPEPGHDERKFVILWLGVLAFIAVFCAFLFYLMMYVF